MNGLNILVDTNILIDLSEGKRGIANHLSGQNLFISVVTEIELLGWHRITAKHKAIFENLIEDCSVIELTQGIKKVAIELKQKHKIKLPDAIFAATSLYLDVPLLTRDSGFEKIKPLNLILIE